MPEKNKDWNYDYPDQSDFDNHNTNIQVQPELTEDQQRKQREDELVKSFFSIKEPEPVIDENKLDRVRRMGRINGLGRGLSVLSDALAVGIGANVQKRNPDQVTPALFQTYQNTIDKYKDEKKAYDRREAERQRQNILFSLNKNRDDANFDLKQQQQESYDKYRSEKLKADNDRYTNDYALKVAGHNLNVAKAENDDKHKTASEKIADYRAKHPASTLKSETPVKIKTANNTYSIMPEEAEFFKGEALKNTELLRQKYPQWFVKEPEYNVDEFGYKTPTGKYSYKLDSRIKDDQLIAAYLEGEEENAFQTDLENRRSYTESLMSKGSSTKKDQAPVSQQQAQSEKKISQSEAKSKWSKYARTSK